VELLALHIEHSA